MEAKRLSLITRHSVSTGDKVTVPANGSRVRVEVHAPTSQPCYLDIYVDSVISGQLAGSFSTYNSGHFEVDATVTGDLPQRRFVIDCAVVSGGTAVIGVVETIVTGDK